MKPKAWMLNKFRGGLTKIFPGPIVDIKRERELEILNTYECLEEDDLRTHGVLLSDEIEHYVKKCKLIDPFEKKNLKPAAYELRVGYEYSMNGEIMSLASDSQTSFIRVPPFHVVVIKTMERVNLPRFLIARWNIRVRKAYDGLLWVGGPQVDPGYVGYLSCPIYNLSDKDVILTVGEEVAVIDFVKTTPFNKKIRPRDQGSKEYNRPPSRVLFEEYLPQTLKSGLVKQAVERVNDIEKKVIKVESFISVAFVAITILFAALTLFVTDKGANTTPATQKGVETASNLIKQGNFPWIYLSLALSLIAIGAVVFTRTKLTKNTFLYTLIFAWLVAITVKLFQLDKWVFGLFH